MPRQIIIGKEGNQPFQISDPKVSRRHACLVIEDNGQMKLIDTQSTNGTFVFDGAKFVRLYANTPYPVYPESMIQLGPETRFHVRRLLAGSPQMAQRPMQSQQPQPAQKKEAPKPKKVDISHLRRISDNYNEKRMKLESKTGMVNGLRSGTILIMVAAGAAPSILREQLNIAEGEVGKTTLVTLAVALVLWILLNLLINSFNKKVIKARNDNEHYYGVKYCCPECGLSFRGKIYENILSERRCPRCKSEFYEKPRR